MSDVQRSILLAAVLLLPGSARANQDGGSPSIEELTKRYRERSEAAVEVLRAEVEYLMAQLEDHAKGERQSSMDLVSEKIVKLGSEVCPLLISSLDPGKRPQRAELALSNQVAEILSRLDTAPVMSPLLKMANEGSAPGQRLSIQVLGFSKSPARVSPVLMDLYAGKEPPRGPILTALARLNGPGDLDFVTAQLRSADREFVNAALYALAQAKVDAASDQVLALAADSKAAAAHVSQLCDWYRACPDAFNKQHGAAVLELTKSSRVNLEDRIALVELLSDHERYWPSGAKKSLETLADSGSTELREAVLVALVLSGDRGAKKDLLLPYEEALARSGRWADAWIDLATIEYRIEEYRDAIKHYEQAMKLGRIDTRRQRDVYLGLARCYAQEKKYKDAQQWLQRAPISRRQLADLAEDPDFVDMAAHSKYGKTFGPAED